MTQLEQLGKYQISEEIGYGGFATVYKAFDPQLQRTVALKVMHPYWQGDPAFVKRFEREGDLMSKLHHPNVARVYETGTLDGHLYIAMEYLPGHTLNDLLRDEVILSLDKAVEILEQVASALDYAHRHGMIHRDIKPANVILTESSQSVRATLLDFGLVKALAGSSALTSQGMLVGSPEYMAPEQANLERRIDVGPAADCYSLGVLAYRMLTGRLPFPGNTPATLNAHENKPVPPPQQFRPDLPDEICESLLIMLSKGPEERFPTAVTFVAQLRAVLDARVNRQQRDEQLAALQAQLEQATKAKRWDEALALTGQIQAVDREYRAVEARIAEAQRLLAESVIKTPERRKWPRLLVGVFGLLILGSLSWALSGLFGRSDLPRNPVLGATWFRPSDSMEMVYVPVGQFLMGSTDGDPDEKPVHSVELGGFWLDRTEVTEAQYAACVADGGCASVEADSSDSQHPVVDVTWQNAAAYCAWAGARLSTEAEWEYAYRGPDARIYPWGNMFDAARLNFCDANCAEEWATTDADDGYAQSAAVGTFFDGASWCGALDLAGNVWEWVGDWYGDAYYHDASSVNPTGPSGGDLRVLRGGSWRSDPYNARGSYRFSAAPDQADLTWGFRCARSSD